MYSARIGTGQPWPAATACRSRKCSREEKDHHVRTHATHEEGWDGCVAALDTSTAGTSGCQQSANTANRCGKVSSWLPGLLLFKLLSLFCAHHLSRLNSTGQKECQVSDYQSEEVK